jgi:DNA polymerase
VTARDLVNYCADLGWREPLEVPDTVAAATAASPPEPVQGDDLEALGRSLDGCSRCPLAGKRKTIVFGEGHPRAPILFIGEAPGAEEDRSGRPFVGQAGQLLDAMIFALGLERRQVYITNVVKCRPPSNRDPEETEMAACSAVLDCQIDLIQPQVIVALGRVAARRLTGTSKSMTAMRGRWSAYRGIPLLPLFHPAYLLRQPIEKRGAWDDLKAIRAKLTEPASD